jgi:hypothetical protein
VGKGEGQRRLPVRAVKRERERIDGHGLPEQIATEQAQ